MKDRDELLAAISKDPFGLLKDSEKKRPLSHGESQLVSTFEEIQNFVEENGCEPASNMDDILEFSLYAKLKAIRDDPKKVKLLKKYDFSGLFGAEDIKEVALEDIIANDPYGLIGSVDEDDIFMLRHVKPSERISPDYLSRRKVCKDFHLYREMFNIIHDELAAKKRKLVKYYPKDLAAGKFYALNGILLYLKSVEGDVGSYDFESGERSRFDGRTVCIFDNATESDMLFRSLDKALQLDGYSISGVLDESNGSEESDADVLNGYIYVLKSRNPKVTSISDLYKIGYTTGSVARRIINARNEATYLFADVDVVATFRCFNLTTYNLEQSIHDFFSKVRLDIELVDGSGNYYRPREWFTVEYKVIEEAIGLIIDNKIQDYEYDPRIDQIVIKNP